MVATLVRLRLRILRHSLAREPWRLVVLVGGAVWALLMLPSLGGAAVWLSGQAPEIVHDVLTVGGTAVLVGWLLVPVLVPAMDDSLDVSRFRTSGVPADRLAPGMLVAGLLGVPTLFTGVVTLTPVAVWALAGVPSAALTALVAAPLALVTAMLGARVSTQAVARLLGSRRSREVGALAGVAVAALLVPAGLAVGSLGLEGALEQVPAAADVLSLTPFGAAWAAPALVAGGDVVGGVLRLVVAAGWVGAGWLVWTRQLATALVRPPGRSGGGRGRADGVLGRRPSWLVTALGGRPGAVAAAAVARRCARSWSSDPRYLSALVAAVLLPVLIGLLGATVVDAPAGVALAVAVLMAGTIGWGRHNDTAFDGTAFWLHVAARTPGWADRLGRVVATVGWAVPAVVLVAVGGAVLSGRADLWPASVGAALGVLAAGLAVSAVSSAVLTYPVPQQGENPYAAQLGSVGASLLAQVVTSVATFVLSVPVLVCFGAALWWRPAAAWAALAVGVVGGGAVLAAGVVLGGRVLDRRAVRVLTRLR